MNAELLLDTGPLVALLDPRQRGHDRCRDVFVRWSRPILTTEAVLTEASHLLGAGAKGVATCLRFVAQGGAILVPSHRARIDRCVELVERYDNVPMDYADATLVALAEELQTDAVFTLDRRGFSVYRWGRRRSFRILPE